MTHKLIFSISLHCTFPHQFVVQKLDGRRRKANASKKALPCFPQKRNLPHLPSFFNLYNIRRRNLTGCVEACQSKYSQTCCANVVAFCTVIWTLRSLRHTVFSATFNEDFLQRGGGGGSCRFVRGWVGEP